MTVNIIIYCVFSEVKVIHRHEGKMHNSNQTLYQSNTWLDFYVISNNSFNVYSLFFLFYKCQFWTLSLFYVISSKAPFSFSVWWFCPSVKYCFFLQIVMDGKGEQTEPNSKVQLTPLWAKTQPIFSLVHSRFSPCMGASTGLQNMEVTDSACWASMPWGLWPVQHSWEKQIE